MVAGSSPVNAGVQSFAGRTAPTDDYNGYPRTGNPDTGALELGSPEKP